MEFEKMNIVKMSEALQYLQDEKNFRASNLQGLKLTYKGEVKSYVVYSYATIIFAKKANGEIFINRLNEKFSRSTGRHQSIVKRAFNIE